MSGLFQYARKAVEFLTGTSVDFVENPPTTKKRSADGFDEPAAKRLQAAGTSLNFPLPETTRPTLVKFEGAEMYITKENQSDEMTSTTWYNFFADDDISTPNLVSAMVTSKMSGKDVERNNMVIYSREFYYHKTADAETVERWEAQKFGSSEYSVVALRSKRGFKFLRLVQVDQAAEAIRHHVRPLVIPVVFGDAWRPYGRSTTPAFGQLALERIEGWISGSKSDPDHFNSRLGDSSDTRNANGWPTIVESLAPLFDNDSPEDIASGIEELEKLELPTHGPDSVHGAAVRIKNKDPPYGSMYGITGDEGRIVYGTGSHLLD